MSSGQSQKSNIEQSLSFEDVSKLFSLPLSEAADILGVSTTVLKKICNENGLERWPHRKYLAGKSIEEIKMEAAKEKSKALGGNSPKSAVTITPAATTTSGYHVKDKSPKSAPEMPELRSNGQLSKTTLTWRSNHMIASGLAIETNTLDEFKYGFPSRGLAKCTNRWWGSSLDDNDEVLNNDAKSSSAVKESSSVQTCDKQDEVSSVCDKQDEISNVCGKQDEVSSVCDKQDEVSSVCDKQDEVSSVCDKQDEVSSVCDKQDEVSSVCDKQDEVSSVCDKKDEVSSMCDKKNDVSSVCDKKDEVSSMCDKKNEDSSPGGKKDEDSSVCDKQDEVSGVCDKQDEVSGVCDKQDEVSGVCDKQDEVHLSSVRKRALDEGKKALKLHALKKYGADKLGSEEKVLMRRLYQTS